MLIRSVRDYIKDVIDVPDTEEKLQVNKYAQLARKDKATIIISLRGTPSIPLRMLFLFLFSIFYFVFF
jgi:hypothetical protein